MKYLFALLLLPIFSFAGDECTPELVREAKVGYRCSVDGFPWEVVGKTEIGSVVKDLTSGIVVSDGVADNDEGFNAQKVCKSDFAREAFGELTDLDWHLPSGYPREENGKASRWNPSENNGVCPEGQELRNGKCYFPDADSEFVILEDHGIRKVARGMDARLFWSSSICNYNCAYVFSGIFGTTFHNPQYSYAGSGASDICVAK